MPAEGYSGVPDVPCPEVGGEARAYWADWATSSYAWFFSAPEWRSLSVAAVLMDRFYAGGGAALAAEVRQRESLLFGLATRSRLHIETAGEVQESPPVAGGGARRRDPRLRSA